MNIRLLHISVQIQLESKTCKSESNQKIPSGGRINSKTSCQVQHGPHLQVTAVRFHEMFRSFFFPSPHPPPSSPGAPLCQLVIKVGIAGPPVPVHDRTGHCRTSTRELPITLGTAGPSPPEKMLQKMLENMSDRTSNRMLEYVR